MGVKNVSPKQCEIPPDGGWGYVIGLAVIVNLVVITSFVPSFGMIFKEMLPELGMDSTSITLVNGVAAFNIAVTGLFTSPVLKYLSIRQLGLLASFAFNLGVFCTVFVKSKIFFFICVGVLQGLGNGLMFNLSITILNSYFVRRRLLAVSFTQTVVGVISLFVPQCVKWALVEYGQRGTLLLISGISLHSVVAMSLMQPVAWHMKRVEIPADKQNGTYSAVIEELRSLLKENSGKEDNMIASNKDPLPQDATDEKELEGRSQQKSYSIKYFVSQLIDVSLLKSFLLSNASLGLGLAVFSDFTFTLMLPQALYSMDWSESNVAWALSLSAMGDLSTKFLFIFLSSWLLNIGSQKIYIFGLVIAFLSRIAMLCSTSNMVLMLVFITATGISRCTVSMLIPVVLAEAVGEAKFTDALGIILMLFGVLNLSLGPVIGAIRDMTGSYTIVFYILTACFGLVSLSWTIELLYKRKKCKRQAADSNIQA